MIESYSHELHYKRLEKWLCHYGVGRPVKEVMSPVGFVVDGIAIGFLFTTQSKQSYMDHVATDPSSNARDRDNALNELFKTIEAAAKESGSWVITALANLPVMRKRFLDHGYKPHGDYTLFFKALVPTVEPEVV